MSGGILEAGNNAARRLDVTRTRITDKDRAKSLAVTRDLASYPASAVVIIAAVNAYGPWWEH